MDENLKRETTRRFTAPIKRDLEEAFVEEFGPEVSIDEIREEYQGIEELEDLISTEVKKPSFPFVMFYIALVLDVLDIADFTGIGWVIMVCVELIFTIILYFWMRKKLSKMFKFGSRMAFRGKRLNRGSRKTRRRGKSRAQKFLRKFANKYLMKYATRRLILIFILNIIPVIGIFSSQAFFVFLAHNRQNKLARKYINTIEASTKVYERVQRSIARDYEEANK